MTNTQFIVIRYDYEPDLDMTNGAGFYQTREEKIEALLNMPSRKLSDGEDFCKGNVDNLSDDEKESIDIVLNGYGQKRIKIM